MHTEKAARRRIDVPRAASQDGFCRQQANTALPLKCAGLVVRFQTANARRRAAALSGSHEIAMDINIGRSGIAPRRCIAVRRAPIFPGFAAGRPTPTLLAWKCLTLWRFVPSAGATRHRAAAPINDFMPGISPRRHITVCRAPLFSPSDDGDAAQRRVSPDSSGRLTSQLRQDNVSPSAEQGFSLFFSLARRRDARASLRDDVSPSAEQAFFLQRDRHTAAQIYIFVFPDRPETMNRRPPSTHISCSGSNFQKSSNFKCWRAVQPDIKWNEVRVTSNTPTLDSSSLVQLRFFWCLTSEHRRFASMKRLEKSANWTSNSLDSLGIATVRRKTALRDLQNRQISRDRLHAVFGFRVLDILNFQYFLYFQKEENEGKRGYKNGRERKKIKSKQALGG
ncbi:hypothetical protein C8R43DRAFT_1109991 [Mycena crocata]|nr:hypothetical protein C8R43DRAFT_1109991 [Mycena crocata]